MKNFLSNVKVPTAVTTRSKFDLSFDHYTTMDFFKWKPMLFKAVIPGDEFDIDLNCLSRTIGALRKPTMSSVTFTHRAFFVPCRTVMHDFDAFITDTRNSNNVVKRDKTPLLANSTWVTLFTDQTLLSSQVRLSVPASDPDDYDFIHKVSSTETYKYKFTDRGRWIYDIVCALGYHVNFSNPQKDTDSMSALPWLAFMKLYCDWYKNSQWTMPTLNIKLYGGDNILYSDLIKHIQALNYVIYDKDYFTSAWPRPTSPNSSDQVSSVVFEDITNDKTLSGATSTVRNAAQPGNNVPSTPSIVGQSPTSSSVLATPANITQYALDRLKQLTDYVKRFQLVGDRALDRFYAMFGIKLPAEKLDRSVYLGKCDNHLQIGEVMATADNSETNTVVGDFSGRANSFGQGHFHFSSDEFGYLFVISCVKPHIGYFQGRDRCVYHINRNDFFNPTWDGIGTQPIRQDELFVDFVENTSDGNWKSNNVFGWSSQFSEYKHSLDLCTGDFRVRSLNTGLEAWHTLRVLPENPSDPTILNITESFTVGDNYEYDRIFNYNSGDVDHFVCVLHFSISAWRNMKPMYEDYDFDGGRLLDMSLGGTTLD